ncbi:MAG: protein kinase [Nitrospirae bacterium]|nr:protein kinase [Nitrospirota bacterium]
MGLEITCPNCKASFKNIPEEHLGKSATCKKCETKFKIQQINNLEDNNQNKPLKNIEITMYKDENKIPFSFKEGDVILDLYEVKSVLGQGGMGIVYKVYHKEWKVDLAMKNPLPKQFDKPKAIENFEREAETWIQLGLHPYVVSCYYVRQLGGTPRVFAECVDGGTLRDWIRNGKLTQIDKIIDVAIQFAWGLHYAHENGVVHQDVKPANVMMTPEGIPKVTDFGLAKYREMTELTSDIKNKSIWVSYGGMTQAYCSPEQASKRPLTRKTDIWSWGISVLEMFTGGVDWIHGQLAPHALDKYIREDNRIKIPDSLADLLKHCFKENPSERHNDMGSISETLKEIYRETTGNDYIRETPKNIKNTPDTLNNMAISMLDLGKKERALELWDKALQIDSQHIESTHNQGLLKYRSGLIHDIEYLDAVYNLLTSKNIPKVNYLLSLAYYECKYYEKSLNLLEDIKDIFKEVNCDNLERILNNKILKKIRTFEGHEDIVRAVSLSHDNRYALSGSDDKTLKLWDVATGECIKTIDGNKGNVTSVSLSHDNRYALSVSRLDALKLWDITTGECVKTFGGHDEVFTSALLSYNNLYALSGGYDKTLKLWDVDSGECIRTFEGHSGHVTSVSLSQDNLYALSGGYDKTLKLWDVGSGECIKTLEGHKGHVTSVSLSQDNSCVLSGSDDKTLKLWYISTGKCVKTFIGHVDRVTSVSLSQNNYYALSGSDDGTLKLWDVTTGECLNVISGHAYDVKFSHDGKLLVFGHSNTCVIYNVITTNNNQYCAGYFLSTVKTSEIESRKQDHYENTLKAIYYNFKINNYKTVHDMLNMLRSDSGYEYNNELINLYAKLYTVTYRSNIRKIVLYKTLKGHSSSIRELIISHDEKYLLSGSDDKTLKLWDISTGECVKTFEGHRDHVTSVSLSQSNSYALSGSDDKTLKLWDISTGECVKTFEGHRDHVTSVSLSQSNSYALSGSDDKTLKLWDINSGECIKTFVHEGHITSVSLSHDNCYALSGTDNKTLNLWDISTGRCIKTFVLHQIIQSASLSQDNRFILSMHNNNSLTLLDVASGDVLKKYNINWAESEGSGDKFKKYYNMISNDSVLRTFVYNKAVYHNSSEETVMSIITRKCHFLINRRNVTNINIYFIDWELEYRNPSNWDYGALPYLYMFITPYVRELSAHYTSTHALPRRGNASWTEEDFNNLIYVLGCAGYGWLRSEGVKEKLNYMMSWYGKWRGWCEGNCVDGQGTYIWPNSDKYIGQWKDRKRHGDGEFFSWADGIKYKGGFKNDMYDGQGTYTYPDGCKYDGEFKDGNKNGQGTETYPDGSQYVGKWKDGKYDGEGTCIYPDGRKYVGQWAHGEKNGQGTMTFPDGCKYVGHWKDDLEHVYGKYTYPNGRKYVGEWRNGRKYGQGTMTFPDGREYFGQWRDDLEHGQEIMTYPDGRKYDCEFKDGECHDGQGIMTYPDGGEYEGQWEDGKYHGTETSYTSYTFTDGCKYAGEWKGSKYHGQGTMIYPDGRKYVGQWRDSKYHGQGTMTYPDGRKYVGQWRDSKYHGQGTMTYPDGRKYVGQWRDSKYHGQGTMTFPDGLKYDGGWKDDKWHGQGTYTYPDGGKYVGEWKDGIQHVQGTYTYPDGGKYVGEWKDGGQHGQGTYTYPDGRKYVGQWRDSKYHGQGTMTFPDGHKYVGQWRDSKYHGQGIYIYPDERRLVGRFKDGVFIGN